MDWMDGYLLDCYDYYSTCGANNSKTVQSSQIQNKTSKASRAWVIYLACNFNSLLLQTHQFEYQAQM